MKVLKHRIIESKPGVFKVQALAKYFWFKPMWEGCIYFDRGFGDQEHEYSSAEIAEKALKGLIEKSKFKLKVVKEIELGEEYGSD